MVGKWAASVVLPALLGACGQSKASAESLALGSEPSTKSFMAQPAPLDDPAETLGEDSEQRRGYGAVDMRFEPCIARDGDDRLRGNACGSGILVYGPYVSVPGNARIEVSFDVQPDRAVEVYADTVSQMGTQVLGGLNAQLVAADRTARLGYFTRAMKPDSNVESRIGIRTDEPVKFVISNLTMTVR